MPPSLKAMEKEREKIREMTAAQYSHMPARELIASLNAHFKGWRGYYKMGHCRRQFRHINHYVVLRVLAHLKRRSQRGYKIPKNISGYRAVGATARITDSVCQCLRRSVRRKAVYWKSLSTV